MKINKTLATIFLLASISVFGQQMQASRAKETLDYADRYWAASRFNEALPYYNQARQLALSTPQDVQVLLALSHRYLSYRNEAAGWDCFDKATSIAYGQFQTTPDWSKYWLGQATSFYDQTLAALMTRVGTSPATRNAIVSRVDWIRNQLNASRQPVNPPTASGQDTRAQFTWNRTADGFTVLNVDGNQPSPEQSRLTGNFYSWQYTGYDPRSGASVQCTGGLDRGKNPAPNATGTMSCEARIKQTVWRCQGRAQMNVEWSVVAGGSGWFAAWPGSCVGTITEPGKAVVQNFSFGTIYIKSGMGLPLGR